MKFAKTIVLLISFLLVFFQEQVKAAGPLIVQDGMVVIYKSKPLVYRFDLGPIGKYSNSDGVLFVKEQFASWESIKSSTMRFQEGSPLFLDFDVNGTNFDPVLNIMNFLGYSPIVFDSDGSVTNALFGNGSANNVLGFASPIRSAFGGDEILESQAVFNGKFINGISTQDDFETSLDSFKGTILHEFGHAFGLGHSQVNVEAVDAASSKIVRDSVPLMFPYGVNEKFIIRPDDIASISLLYPNQSELNKYGKIEGRVLKSDKVTPLLGANVIARDINDPFVTAVSCISGYLKTGESNFSLPVLPPGSYTLEVEQISPLFFGGSGVGPYTSSMDDESFKYNLTKGYYIGPNQPLSPDKNQALVINVGSGQTVGSLDLITGVVPLEIINSGGGSNSGDSSNSSSCQKCSSSSQCSIGKYCDLTTGCCVLNPDSCISGCTSNNQCINGKSCLNNCCSEISSPPLNPDSGGGITGDGNINEIEPNNSLETAQLVVLPAMIFAHASVTDFGAIKLRAGDEDKVIFSDLFKFTISNPSTVTISLEIESNLSQDDLDLVLLSADGSRVLGKSTLFANNDELINKSLKPGTYIAGVGAFSGSTNYTLSLTAINDLTADDEKPSVNLSGQDTLVLLPGMRPGLKLLAEGLNFLLPAKCLVSSSESALRIKPKMFRLSNLKNQRFIKLGIPGILARAIKSSGTTKTVNIKVTCENGAESSMDIMIKSF